MRTVQRTPPGVVSERGQQIQNDDKPQCSAQTLESGIALRPYQLEAVEAVLRDFAAGHRRCSVSMPTGSGKTVVFAELIRRRPGRALVLAHRDELLTSAVEKLRLVMPGADIGIVKAERYESGARIVVASVQSLRGKRLAAFPRDFHTVVVDEAHHAPAKSYKAILAHVGSFDA